MTKAKIEAAALSETTTGKAIVSLLLERHNQPCDYFALMHLGSNGTVARAVTRMLDDGLLERVPNERKTMMLVRLAGYEPN